MRRAALLAVAALAGCGGAGDSGTRGGDENRPATVLREDGLVLLVRHATTEPKTDREERLESCGAQRQLTRAGRVQARAIGAALRATGFRARDVRASPMCRARDTARLAFGRATLDRRLLQLGTDGTVRDDARRVSALRRLLRTASPGTVLVTHTPNIGEATGLSLREGEIAVFRRGDLVERLPPEVLLAGP